MSSDRIAQLESDLNALIEILAAKKYIKISLRRADGTFELAGSSGEGAKTHVGKELNAADAFTAAQGVQRTGVTRPGPAPAAVPKGTLDGVSDPGYRPFEHIKPT